MEIVAAPGVVGELDAVLGVPAIPVQPEMDRIPKIRRTKAPTGIAFMPMKRARAAYLPASTKFIFMIKFFITAIVVCGTWGDYCPNGHLKDRGEDLNLEYKFRGKRRTARHLRCADRRIGFGWIQAQSKEPLLKLRASTRFPRRWNRLK